MKFKEKRRRHSENSIVTTCQWNSLPSQKSSQHTSSFSRENSHESKMSELKPKRHNYLAPFEPEVTRAILIFSTYVIMIVIKQSNRGNMYWNSGWLQECLLHLLLHFVWFNEKLSAILHYNYAFPVMIWIELLDITGDVF